MEPSRGLRWGAAANSKKSQDIAFMGAAFIIMTMGFYIAWSAYLLVYPSQWILIQIGTNSTLHAVISWHVAFVAGAAVAAYLVPKFQKNRIYYISAILTIISGALMIPLWSDITPIIVARYIAGVAHGMVFLTLIIHLSEAANSKFRGRILGSISFYLATSLFIGFMLIGLMQYLDSPDFIADQLLGILTLVYAVIALILTRITFVESPIFYLENNDNAAALTALAKLRNETVTSTEVHQELSEMQSFVDDQRSESKCIFGGSNLRPLLRVTLIRGLYSVSTAVVFYIFAYLFLLSDLSQFGLGVVSTARFLAEGVAIYVLDRAGRRKMFLISTAMSGILLFITGCLFFSNYDYALLITSGILFIMHSLALGLGLAPVSVVYMGESFPLKSKPLALLFVLFVEQALQIIMFIIFRFATIRPEPLFMIVGIFHIIFAIGYFFSVPETKRLTLKESKNALK